MSLMLKGVNLPKKGEALSLFMMADGQVIITHIKDSRIWEYSEAEAIQIKEDHGNLKDVDAIYRAFSKCAENETDEGKMEVYAQLMQLLLQAPTVLEEEE